MFDAEGRSQAERPLDEPRQHIAGAQRHLAEAETRVRNAIRHLESVVGNVCADPREKVEYPKILAAVLDGSVAGVGVRTPSPAMPDETPYLLVVDAHDASRSALADLIRERGYRVLEAGRGEDLPADGAALPALVVLDTGPFVTRAIQAVGRMRRSPATAAIPVLMLAPIFCTVERDCAVAAGCAACLPKPADPGELLATIDRIMSRRAVDAAPVSAPALIPLPM